MEPDSTGKSIQLKLYCSFQIFTVFWADKMSLIQFFIIPNLESVLSQILEVF